MARSAYEALCASCLPQSILVGGESGAGKTETTKLCMRGLAQASGSSGRVADAVLESGIALEAFGNAKTTHNHNSSRFGKWCAVHFDARGGFIAGATVDSFLLEKSRVVSQGAGERNYHVFYQLLTGATADERATWRLKPGGGPSYAYTSGLQEAPGVDDVEGWCSTRAKLALFGFSPEQQAELFGLLAAVLALAFGGGRKRRQRWRRRWRGPAARGDGARRRGGAASGGTLALVRRSDGAPRLVGQRGSSYKVPLAPQRCVVAALARRSSEALRLCGGAAQRRDGQRGARHRAPSPAAASPAAAAAGRRRRRTVTSCSSVARRLRLRELRGQLVRAAVHQLRQREAAEALHRRGGAAAALDYQREGISTAAISFPDNSAQIQVSTVRWA